MLLIPAIDLRGGRCVRLRDGAYQEERDYFVDPVRMAKLWRVMNAKLLHLADLDADPEELARTRATVARIAEALDIPLQFSGGIASLDDIRQTLALGVSRVALGRAFADDPDLLAAALDEFGSQVLPSLTPETAAHAPALARRGVRRVLAVAFETPDGPDLSALRSLADALGNARLTVGGGIGGYADLLAVGTLAGAGVDSAIVGRALYENRFPCQRFWCWHRKDEVDLDRFSTARLALQGKP